MLETSFSNASSSKELLANEKLMRQNASVLTELCHEIAEKRRLPLTMLCAALLENATEGKTRADNITPSRQHEETHIVKADALMKSVGTKWINKEKYGSEDALFAAIYLHDMVEDFEEFNLSKIRIILENGIEKLFKEEKITIAEHLQAYADTTHALNIVQCVSRNLNEGSRPDQSSQWLEHPYAFLLKQIDWCHKLATMAGVNKFEEKNFSRMAKNLSETAYLFQDEQQALKWQAEQLYPEFKKPYETLDSLMSILYQTMWTYAALRRNELDTDFDSGNGSRRALYIQESLLKCGKFLRSLPRACNDLSPAMDRLEQIGAKDPKIKGFYEKIVLPSLMEFSAAGKPPSHAGILSRAFGRVCNFGARVADTVWKNKPDLKL